MVCVSCSRGDHCIWRQASFRDPKCKRVMIADGFINLFKDGSHRVPGCVASYVEGFLEFWHLQRGDLADGRLQVMEGFLAFIGPLDTHLGTCLAGTPPHFQ